MVNCDDLQTERMLDALEAIRMVSPGFVDAEKWAQQAGFHEAFLGGVARILQQCFDLSDSGIEITPDLIGIPNVPVDSAQFLIDAYLDSQGEYKPDTDLIATS